MHACMHVDVIMKEVSYSISGCGYTVSFSGQLCMRSVVKCVPDTSSSVQGF